MGLPDDAFETGLVLTLRVDRYALITVRMCRYSVPARVQGQARNCPPRWAGRCLGRTRPLAATCRSPLGTVRVPLPVST
ncbi:Mu transposase domain-containing protein [Embleya scabrispora]|uniref:Mu transposase domain-containing protein n=1 Tax=Embleya scabrispora TaxID=159449 RepID=UPI003CCC1E3C